jgi:hypothetical protein
MWVLWSHMMGHTVTGWASIAGLVLIIGSIQLLMLGIFGEYLGRMYLEAKKPALVHNPGGARRPQAARSPGRPYGGTRGALENARSAFVNKSWSVEPGIMAYPELKIGRHMPYFALLDCGAGYAFVLAVLLRAIPLTHDVVWQLWIARQLLQGAEIYRDIWEVNPPLWFLVSHAGRKRR